MRRPPTTYLATLGALALLGVFLALVYFGVPPFDNLAVFILSQIVGAFTLLVFGVLGGAFVGLVLAHRIFSNREFSPFERTVLQSLEEIRERLDKLEEHAARQEEERVRR